MTKRSIKLVVAFPWWKWIVNPFGMWRVKKFMRSCEDIVIQEMKKPDFQAEFDLRMHNLRVYGHPHPEILIDWEKVDE